MSQKTTRPKDRVLRASLPPGDRTRHSKRESHRFKRRVSILLSIVIIAVIIALLLSFRAILFPFIVALILAYVLEPFVGKVARRGLPRWISVILVYICFLGAVWGFGYYLFPKLGYEGEKAIARLQELLRDAPNLYESVESKIESILGGGQLPQQPPPETSPAGGASDERLASRWGFGPNLFLNPTDQSSDVLTLEPVEFMATERALLDSEALRMAPRDSIQGVWGDSDASDDKQRRSNLIIEELQPGVFGVRLRDTTIEVESVGEGRINITPQAQKASENRLQDLQREIVSGLKTALEKAGSGMLSGFLGFTQSIVQGVLGTLIGVVLVFMVAAFMLIGMDDIRPFFRGVVPPKYRTDYDELLTKLDEGLSGVVRGQLLICLVNGVLSGIGFAIFIPEYAIVLAIFAGVMSLIPIFGTIISSVPAVLVGLTSSFATGLFVLVWILGIHFIEANMLNPKIIGTSAKINPVIVVFVLIAGEHMYGLAGALLAVPATSIVQTLISFIYARIRPFLWEGLTENRNQSE